jgi:hypothetical protein
VAVVVCGGIKRRGGARLSQQLDAARADVAVRLGDGGECRREVFAERDAVEAHDAEIARHSQSREMRRAHRADGEQVAGAEPRGGATGFAECGGDATPSAALFTPTAGFTASRFGPRRST